MTQIVKLKRSAVPGKIPTTADIDLGELAINTYDGKVFMKKDNGVESIVDLSSSNNITAETISQWLVTVVNSDAPSLVFTSQGEVVVNAT